MNENLKQMTEAWLAYCKAYGMDSMNRNTFAIFKAGWEAALKPKDESWKSNTNDQA
jgi:hypothetical protein